MADDTDIQHKNDSVVSDTVSSDIIVSDSDSRQLVTFTGDTEWAHIVNALVDELDSADMPDKVVQVTELMLAGWPTYKAAKQVGVSASTVRRWMTRYPTMAAVLSNGKKLLSVYRMAKLEQQYAAAVERSQEILDVDLADELVNSKILTVVAAQARYIIGLFAGQKVDVTVTHELGDTVMKAKEDALDYIAQGLAEQRGGASVEPIEATYRIVDGKIDDDGPMLEPDGGSPFGELGELDVDHNGILCHICGNRYKSMHTHLSNKHNMTTNEYEILYLLEEGEVRSAQNS